MNLSQCRLRIVSYLDDLVNNVDLKAEQALAQGYLDEIEIGQVNERRGAIISRVRQVQDHNLAHLDKTYKEEEFERLGETEIDARLFHKFCFLIDGLKRIEYASFIDRIFGHFVVVDRFVREDTLAAFRELLDDRWPNKKRLSFEPAEDVDSIESDVFTADNLMIECTTEELLKLKSVEIKYRKIKSIKEPARVLFENIQRVSYSIIGFSEQFIESVELIGRHADEVHLTCHIYYFSPSVMAWLSDIKIKSLRILESEYTDGFDGQFSLADFLLPFVHLEELEIAKYNEHVTIEHERIKLDRLRKLTLKNCEADVQFIELFDNLNELVLEEVPDTAEAFIKKKLKKIKQLQRLEIWHGEIYEIESESFEGLHSLTSLDLNSNNIEKIHENAFVHLNNLTHLNLSWNSLDTLDSSALNGLTSLTSLDLSKCFTTPLEENLFYNLRSITDLNLSGNRMTTICKPISCLSHLKELDLSSNSIQTLDGDILENLMDLETLDLSDNKITSLKQNVFQRLAKLQKLSLNKNELSSIEAGAFFSLSALKTLDLSINKISSIEPAAFSPIAASLEHLDLQSNKINKLEFKRLEKPISLRYLDLSRNYITHIESKFFSLFPQLETLILRYNEFTQFKTETFWSLESLVHLDLSNNKIEYLHPELLKSQRRLKRLFIYSNDLQAITCDTFSANLTSLEKLYLNDNPISSIQANSFDHLRRLKYCDVSGIKC